MVQENNRAIFISGPSFPMDPHAQHPCGEHPLRGKMRIHCFDDLLGFRRAGIFQFYLLRATSTQKQEKVFCDHVSTDLLAHHCRFPKQAIRRRFLVILVESERGEGMPLIVVE